MVSIIFVSRISSLRWADWAAFKAALMVFLPDASPFLFAGFPEFTAGLVTGAVVVRLKKRKKNLCPIPIITFHRTILLIFLKSPFLQFQSKQDFKNP